MLRQKTFGARAFDFINIVFMCLVILATLLPFLYVAFASVSLPSLLISHRGMLFLPLGFQLDSYKLVFDNPMISQGYMNTLMYLSAGTVLNLFMTSLAAYAFSRTGYFWKKPLLFFVVFTMYFSGGLIPLYITVMNMNMLDKIFALIFPSAISTYNMIIMRTSFASIPVSLEESARLDGANDLTIMMRIILPLSMPVIAVMILFYGVGHWNSWFPAMMYLTTRTKYPLQLILREILVQNSLTNMLTEAVSADKEMVALTVKYSTIMVATLPILCIYPFLQKYFVKGIMVGALKG